MMLLSELGKWSWFCLLTRRRHSSGLLLENLMKSIDGTFYRSTEWKRCRRAYLDYVSGRCERCLERGLHVPAKIVHHKVYLSPENYNDPSIAYNFENLEALCQNCHNEEHFKDQPRWKIIDGEVVSKERIPPVS